MSPDKAYSKNTLIVVEHRYASLYGCSITPELSRYAEQEEEVLLACYSAFQLQRVERCNKQTIVSLYLHDYYSALPDLG